MELRAQSIVFWPGMSHDIQQIRSRCRDCNRNAPSQAPLPSEPATPPSTPFEQVFADFFDFAGHHYLIVGDRLSGWPEIFSTPTGSPQSGARGLIACLRSCFSTFGVPEELSSDGGPEFIASATQGFLSRWDVNHRKSAAYYAQSNGRAEVAVKAAKRLLCSNVSASGVLDNDKLLRALLQLRNTPDPDCNLSPAQIIFGRPIRDAFSFVNRLEKFSNPAVRPMWREAWAAKESALRARFVKSSESLNEHSRHLSKLEPGDRCFVQNQSGSAPKKWDRTGVVVEARPHDQYVIKVDGSGRLTTRNRRFLRTFRTASAQIERAPLTGVPSGALLLEEIPAPDLRAGSATKPPPEGIPSPGPREVSVAEPPAEEILAPEEFLAPEPVDVPVAGTPPLTEKPTPHAVRVPAALRRLQDFNLQGLEEAIKPSGAGGRPRRGTMNLGGCRRSLLV